VKKTSIYVDPEVDRALARRAAAEGTTKAALIREAGSQPDVAAEDERASCIVAISTTSVCSL
jgi:predicted transcriptional regulator